jgi:hypothetical protein
MRWLPREPVEQVDNRPEWLRRLVAKDFTDRSAA